MHISVQEQSFFRIRDDPIQPFNKVLSGHSTAPEYSPLVGDNLVKLEALFDVVRRHASLHVRFICKYQ